MSVRFLKQYHVVPIGEDDNNVTLLVADPADTYRAPGRGASEREGRRSQGRIPFGNRRSDRALLRPGSFRDGHDRREPDRRTRPQRRRHRASARSRLRSAGHPARQPRHPARRRTARVRYPHRAVREPAEGALSHRRRAARSRIAAGGIDRRGDFAHQDHGEAQHRRAPPAAGRPHHVARAGQGARPARLDRADLRSANRW